jgi:hypothetical protein
MKADLIADLWHEIELTWQDCSNVTYTATKKANEVHFTIMGLKQGKPFSQVVTAILDI